jgi:hypothetical protein
MGGPVKPLPCAEVHDIQEKLGDFIGRTPQYPDECKWYLFKPRRDPHNVPGIGMVYVVDKFDDQDYEDFSGPRWIVFRIGDRYFRVTGKNTSHVGEDWEYPHFREVTGKQVRRITWSNLYDDV